LSELKPVREATEKEKRIINRLALRDYVERIALQRLGSARRGQKWWITNEGEERIQGIRTIEDFRLPYPEADIVEESDSNRKTSQELLVEFLGGQCKVCGSTDNLEKHHIIPLEKGGPDTVQNLMVLCRECHGKTF